MRLIAAKGLRSPYAVLQFYSEISDSLHALGRFKMNKNPDARCLRENIANAVIDRRVRVEFSTASPAKSPRVLLNFQHDRNESCDERKVGGNECNMSNRFKVNLLTAKMPMERFRMKNFRNRTNGDDNAPDSFGNEKKRSNRRKRTRYDRF
jgi:hypothetical protein